MSIAEKIVDVIRGALAEQGIMRVTADGKPGFVRLERRPWVLLDVAVFGMIADAARGARYVDDVAALARTILRGTDAALPSEKELDGPGDWRRGIAEAVRRVPPPDGVLLVKTATLPAWQAGIARAVVDYLPGAGAIVVRPSGY
jgi:hypothetical protein